jgi:hypothetical protein
MGMTPLQKRALDIVNEETLKLNMRYNGEFSFLIKIFPIYPDPDLD